jgi:hypothetical protein
MKGRLRTLGIAGSLAALMATGALLLPAAPVQAMPRAGGCEMIESEIGLALANEQWVHAFELWEQGAARECW